ncbi:Amidase [Parasponia andersonii]|uniref:Amidase n=1 Tax=Parasponia andersonii TaxID=3476 RepID=A0A2P5DVE8_PARAD|nr:Amidase [Parasponia andersonii]
MKNLGHQNCNIGVHFLSIKITTFQCEMPSTLSNADHLVKNASLGDYVKDKVPSFKIFLSKGNAEQEYEFKDNHGEWVKTVKPDLGPGIPERLWEALETTDENIDVCRSVKTELRAALTALLGDFGVIAIPTLPRSPPKTTNTCNHTGSDSCHSIQMLLAYHWGSRMTFLCRFPYWRNMAQMGSCSILWRPFIKL